MFSTASSSLKLGIRRSPRPPSRRTLRAINAYISRIYARQLLSKVRFSDSWTTAGVVVAREVRKSANGKDYLIWKMHDLKDCQQPPVVVLLFGEAFKEHWKLQPGICVALMTPVIADNDKNPNAGADKFKVTLKVFKPVQIVELGYSTDLGTCKGVKLDGQRCSNFVNVSFSEYCIHHVMKEVRKLSANRGEPMVTAKLLKSLRNKGTYSDCSRTGLPNKPTSFVSSAGIDGTIRPTTSNVFKSSELKTTSKEEEKQTLQEIITHRVSGHMWHSLALYAIRDLLHPPNDKYIFLRVRGKCKDSLKEHDIAAQGLEAQKHLDSLEAREKVETFVSECMSVKDVKVVSCKKCGYTAQRQSDLCMRQGHCVTHTTAEKRFFKCGGCQRRTTAFSMMPTKPCKHCDANQWIRVAMKDERKVKLENEKLLVRGEERKFVNT
ncbi:unnamed protein product [Heligmosomoides polygyrus]|uniref:Protein MCM10 homolog n=1 Tax=Heligmosomoides polygyrus TaxID=6339 RepID=A0A3P7WNT4_HELPZ|nr:unnamed protein product [Heligmosomoides polygyrus]